MMTRHAWIGAAALCLTLAACSSPQNQRPLLPLRTVSELSPSKFVLEERHGESQRAPR